MRGRRISLGVLRVNSARNLALLPGEGEIPRLAVESHVIPATRRPKALGRRAKAAIHFAQMDPRFRGGDDGYDIHFYAWAAGP